MKDGLKKSGRGKLKAQQNKQQKKQADTIRQKRSSNNREEMLSDIFCIFMEYFLKSKHRNLPNNNY